MAKDAVAIGYLLTNQRTPFYLVDCAKVSHETKWDPWPAPKPFKYSVDHLLSQALDVVEKRNDANLENSLDRLTLLKASSSKKSRRRRPRKMELYSIRSPSTLPFKLHLWIDPGSKEVMARKNGQCCSLASFLKRYPPVPLDEDRLKELWQAWVFNAQALELQKLPQSSYDDLMRRWSTLKGFRFLDLPGELRNKIYRIATMGPSQNPIRDQQYARPSWPRFAGLSNRNLFHVNEQVRKETLAIVWSRTTACFSPRRNLKLLPYHSFLLRQDCLQSIKVYADLPRLLDFFGAPVHPEWRPHTALAAALKNHLNLQHIRIQVSYDPTLRCQAPHEPGCQRIVCGWILAAAKDNIKHIRHIEMVGFIDNKQTAAFLNGIDRERKGLTDGKEEVMDWENTQWVYPPPCLCERRCPLIHSFNFQR